jgi:large subunit ribosomal protein L30
MILVIRISGMINIPQKVQETLHRMRIRRKYAAVILKNNEENRKLLLKVRNYVAFGKISKETLEKLVKLRGQKLEKKELDAKKVVSELGEKNMQEVGLKPFFRLHPPRGGIEAKKHFGVGKGVLGNNKEKINELVEKML